VASTGQGWEQIRAEWDLPRLMAWNKYTAEHPPLHLMVTAYLGVKPKPDASRSAEQLVTELAQGGIQAQPFTRPVRRDLMPWLKTSS
jgi:hypothetical protein